MNPAQSVTPSPKTTDAPKPAKPNRGFKFDSKSLRFILIAVVGISVVAFVAIASLGISFLSRQSKSMVNLKLKSATADAQLSSLETAKKQIEKYSYFKAIADEVIPNDKDQAEAVVQINQFATQSGFLLQNITFPASTLGVTALSTVPSTTPSAKTAVPTLTQAKPVSGIPGLYSLQLTITPQTGNTVPADQQVSYPKILDFLNRIEKNRRTAQITDVSIQPASGNQSLSFTLTINIFIKP
ncbi:MAG TPA: hypothetical protein VFP32_02970 [Candidatus Saccharimonadales bacterium]|nr:hypothetical protein [Candidatus Saccharimonadales bacterium]